MSKYNYVSISHLSSFSNERFSTYILFSFRVQDLLPMNLNLCNDPSKILIQILLK